MVLNRTTRTNRAERAFAFGVPARVRDETAQKKSRVGREPLAVERRFLPPKMTASCWLFFRRATGRAVTKLVTDTTLAVEFFELKR